MARTAGPRSDSFSVLSTVIVLLLGVVSLFAALTWLLQLETALPDIRAPRTDETSQVLSGHLLMSPGYHDIREIDASLEGEWLLQEIGNAGWLTSEQEESNIRAAFYGTQLYIYARVGPEAGRAYVTVDGQPSPLLVDDEIGSFTDLWAVRAADRPIRVATGLAHGEHLVEIMPAGDGEVAISGFEVIAETPFPWAFVLGYAGLTAGLFLVVRRLLSTLTLQPQSSLAARRTGTLGDHR